MLQCCRVLWPHHFPASRCGQTVFVFLLHRELTYSCTTQRIVPANKTAQHSHVKIAEDVVDDRIDRTGRIRQSRTAPSQRLIVRISLVTPTCGACLSNSVCANRSMKFDDIGIGLLCSGVAIGVESVCYSTGCTGLCGGLAPILPKHDDEEEKRIRSPLIDMALCSMFTL